MSLFYIFPSAHYYTLKMGALSFSEALVPIYHTQEIINQNVIGIFTAMPTLIRLCPYMLHSFIVSSLLRQINGLFQSALSIQRDLLLLPSVSSNLSFP